MLAFLPSSCSPVQRSARGPLFLVLDPLVCQSSKMLGVCVHPPISMPTKQFTVHSTSSSLRPFASATVGPRQPTRSPNRAVSLQCTRRAEEKGQRFFLRPASRRETGICVRGLISSSRFRAHDHTSSTPLPATKAGWRRGGKERERAPLARSLFPPRCFASHGIDQRAAPSGDFCLPLLRERERVVCVAPKHLSLPAHTD